MKHSMMALRVEALTSNNLSVFLWTIVLLIILIANILDN